MVRKGKEQYNALINFNYYFFFFLFLLFYREFPMRRKVAESNVLCQRGVSCVRLMEIDGQSVGSLL